MYNLELMRQKRLKCIVKKFIIKLKEESRGMKQHLQAMIDQKKIFLSKMRSEYQRYISLAEKYPKSDHNNSYYLSIAGRTMREIEHINLEIKKLESELTDTVENASFKQNFGHKPRKTGIEYRDNSK